MLMIAECCPDMDNESQDLTPRKLEIHPNMVPAINVERNI